MEYLQYSRANLKWQLASTILSFKPYYKWNTFNTLFDFKGGLLI